MFHFKLPWVAKAIGGQAQLNADIDGDGTLDTGIQFTVTAPTPGNSPVKYYEAELWKADAQGSSGSMTGYTLARKHTFKAEDYRSVSDTLAQVKCSSSKWWKVRVRGIGFNGTPGGWSPFSADGVKPAGYSNTMPTVVWVTPSGAVQPIVAKPKNIVLRWVQIALATYPQAKEIVIYRNTSNNSATATEIGTAAPGAQRYSDNDDLVAGTTYYYWLKVRDRQNAVSASFSAAQSIAWRVVEAGDTDQTALAAPSCLNSSAATVANACYIVQDNQDVNGDGSVDIALTVSWLAVPGAVRYDVEVSRSGTSGGVFTVTGLGGSAPDTSFSFKANTTKFYKVRVRARSFNGTPGAWTTNVVVLTTATAFSSYAGFKPAPKSSSSWNPPVNVTLTAIPLGVAFQSNTDITDPDYWYTEFKTSGTNTPPSAGTEGWGMTINGQFYMFLPNGFGPLGSTVGGVGHITYGWVRHVDRSGNATAWQATSPANVTPELVPIEYMAADSVGGTQVIDGSITYPKLSGAVFNNGISAMGLGDLGTYALLKKTNAGTSTPGDTVSGSNLVYTDTGLSSGSNPSGTWMAMGRCPQNQATQWLRVS